jgi:hypothetical protein
MGLKNGHQPVRHKLLMRFKFSSLNLFKMNNLFRGLIAGYWAKKLGGGCLGTVLVFIIIWVALGQCQ